MRQSIRLLSLAVLCTVLFAGVTHADPQPGQPGDFGLGAIIGEPTGLTAKYWYSPRVAIDGGVAWHFGGEDRIQIHADHLWHIPLSALQVPNGSMPLYVGGGLRVIAGDNSEAGFRIPLGTSFLFSQVPVELFGEIVPVVEFAPDTEAELDFGIGVRYYFKAY